MTGSGMIHLLILALIAICVFFLAQWLVPVVFTGMLGVAIPPRIVNIIALLIAVGVVIGWGRLR